MAKPSYHIFYFLIFSGPLFISCKGKKEAASLKESEISTSAITEKEIKFGNFYVDACALRMKGNLEEAKNLLLECEKIDPESPAVQYELATVYKLLGVNDRALSYAKACAENSPDNEWYQLLMVECYSSLKNYKESAKILEGLLKKYPDKIDFKEDLAIEYQRLGQIDKALKMYDELEKSFGINEELCVRKSKLYSSLGKNTEAERELIRLSQSDPRETRYYSLLADYYLERKQAEKAKIMYDKIISIDAQNPIVNLALHDYYSQQGNTEIAFDHLKKAFLNPDLDVLTKSNIVNSILDKKMDLPYYREHVTELVEVFIKVHPESSEANAVYADWLGSQQKFDDASVYYFRAAIKDKGNYSVWERLLSNDGKLNRFDSLEHHSARAMEYFPIMAQFYYFNGYANIQLHNFSKAANSLKDGMEFVVDNNFLMTDFYKSLGEAFFYSGDYEKSFKAFDDALKIDSDNKEVLNQFAYYLCVRGTQLDKAEKLARRANELEQNNPSFMDTYGWILYNQKNYRDAEAWLSVASRPGVRNPIMLEHYGDLLFRLGKKSDALQYWENAIKNGGNSPALLKKQKEKKLDD